MSFIGSEDKNMKVITAVKKYLNTNREIFLESLSNGAIISVNKDKDFYSEFGDIIADAKVRRINDVEDPDAVTIYIV